MRNAFCQKLHSVRIGHTYPPYVQEGSPDHQNAISTGAVRMVPVSALTHMTRIRGDFDVANSSRYRAGFAPMVFQWSHSHMKHFSL